jgi:hypothetical protein
MSFTRFHDDPCRISKQNQQATDPGRWILDVPGNGTKPCFVTDPQIRSQKWGGNLWHNKTNLESNLLGIDRKLTKCNIGTLQKSFDNLYSYPESFPTCDTLTTQQSRVTNPAWLYKDLEQPNWNYLPDDPQSHVFRQFSHNISSRIIEKDNFKRTFDCLSYEKGGSVPTFNRNTHYVGGPNTCSSSNSCERIF